MKMIIVFLFSGAFLACNNSANTEVELDSLVNKIENKSENIIDTAKATINRWEDSLDNDRDDTSKY